MSRINKIPPCNPNGIPNIIIIKIPITIIGMIILINIGDSINIIPNAIIGPSKGKIRVVLINGRIKGTNNKIPRAPIKEGMIPNPIQEK